MNETQIKVHLYSTAWKNLGIPYSTGLKVYIDAFLLTGQYKSGVAEYWDNPLAGRGGVPDDLNTQRWQKYLEEEFLNFLVERFDYQPYTSPLPRGNNGEITA